MHSIRRERKRILAGVICLLLVMIWKETQVGCGAEGKMDPKTTCACE